MKKIILSLVLVLGITTYSFAYQICVGVNIGIVSVTYCWDVSIVDPSGNTLPYSEFSNSETEATLIDNILTIRGLSSELNGSTIVATKDQTIIDKKNNVTYKVPAGNYEIKNGQISVETSSTER